MAETVPVLHYQRVGQLPEDVRSCYRFFAFYLANGTLCLDLLDGIDYRPALMRFASTLEQVMAVFSNVLDVDERGRVTNAGDAEWRAAQYIRRYCDREYTVEPPFEAWELELP
ncbi:hypothetical protein [Micromonospora sp. NBC_01412]|uniref:DUF7677 family protein n=1 Tax=Micromonospora sp. NBC_01412 TaxID=2903590 RepID=UPI003245B36E